MKRARHVWFGFCLVVGMMALSQAVSWYMTQDELYKNGVATEAKVQRMETTPGGPKAPPSHYVALSFPTIDGTAVSVVHRTGDADFVRLKVGDKVQVFYLPRDPNVVSFSKVRPQISDVSIMIFVAIGILICGLCDPSPVIHSLAQPHVRKINCPVDQA